MAMPFLLTSFITIFVVVDSIGNLPFFESLLHGAIHRDRLKLITLSTFVAMIVLLVFTFAGLAIFSYFGIKFYSFKIAGGILLLIISLQMLFGIKHTLAPSEESNIAKKEDVAIVPMAVPLQTGPAAITSGIILASQATNFTMQGYLFLAILLVFLANYFIYLKSEYFFKLFGEIGTKITTRIMGVILAALAVQFIINGIVEAAALI